MVFFFWFQVKTLENRVQVLQDDLFNAQDELQAAQEGFEKVSNSDELKVATHMHVAVNGPDGNNNISIEYAIKLKIIAPDYFSMF